MASQTLPSTQTALVQETYAGPFTVKSIPVPEATLGSAVIKVLSSGIVSYSKTVYNGTRKYPYPTPMVPGCSAIGRVAAVGPDSTLLNSGQLVYIDPVFRSRDNPADQFLQGFHQGGTAGSKKLITDVWRDGSWAEYCRVPLENVFILDEDRLVGELGYTPADLTLLGQCLVPYGGLSDIKLQAGETIIVSPATGKFGGAAVAVAKAMGANVVAMGRNEEVLQRIAATYGVKTVKITNNYEEEVEALKKASGKPFDAAFDISPPMALNSTHIKSCIAVLGQNSRYSVMGGLHGDYPIPMSTFMHKNMTLKGTWMYGREEVHRMIKMVEAGVLKIGTVGGKTKAGDFTLEEWEHALDISEANSAWDVFTVIGPSPK